LIIGFKFTKKAVVVEMMLNFVEESEGWGTKRV